MARFVVETFVPQGDARRFGADVEGIQVAAREAPSERRVRHVESYLVPADEMGFHVVEADSAADVEHVTTLARIEVERIVTSVSVGPGGRARRGMRSGRGRGGSVKGVQR